MIITIPLDTSGAQNPCSRTHRTRRSHIMNHVLGCHHGPDRPTRMSSDRRAHTAPAELWEQTGEQRTTDRGQAAVVVVTVVAVLLVVFSLAVAQMGRTTVDRTRAQTAADAAALASLEGGADAAADLAGRHGAIVIGWSRSGFEVTVTVRLGDVNATARASDEP
jgi:Putative Flp pilus-assembly TadE/G-like